MQNRRQFIKNTLGASLLLTVPAWMNELYAKKEFTRLTILHTNDMHSRIEPFPSGNKFEGRGGMAARAALIQKIRTEEKNILLLDSGDVFQGTPYFNFFGGELEFKLMSEMKYDAATLGNHDFDAGLDGFVKQLPHAAFPFLIANYNFSDTIMHNKTERYKIFSFGKLKVGVFGVGIELQGLVPKKLYGNTIYLDPISEANKTAKFLKHEMKCHYIICLSHLGYKYDTSKVSDIVLARASRDIDMILGGHTHTFMQQPHVMKNDVGTPIIISQSGWAGLILGKSIVIFDEKNKCIGLNFSSMKI